MKLSRLVAAAAALGFALQASADTFEFDTISEYQAGSPSAITGILRNSATPITTAFQLAGGSAAATGCVPIILTMLEKPGRYYLTIVTDPNGSPPWAIRCTLTLRN